MRKKYESEGNCTGKEECKGQWYAGPWTAVSLFNNFCVIMELSNDTLWVLNWCKFL